MRKHLQGTLKKDMTWSWNEQDTRYVDKVKKHIINLPTLYHTGPDDQMIIETDASIEFWGVVLKSKVKVEEQLFRVTSGSFQGPDLNCHSNEKNTWR
jgi:hypothetical protein